MDSGKRDERQRQEEILAIAHDTELEVLARDFDDEIASLVGQYVREHAALRTRTSEALARIVAGFEKKRAAAVGRFQVKKQMLRSVGLSAPLVVGKA